MDGGAARVFVGVHGSVGSLHALRRAVTEARARHAVLYSVIAWTPPGGETLDRRLPDPHLRRVWTSAAMRVLRAAWQDALGGVPGDLPVHLLAHRGRPGWVLCGLADAEDDLVVIGAGRPGPLRRATRHSVARYCCANATCGVLVVPPPALARTLDRGVLPASLRHRRAMHDLLHHG